MSNRKKISVGGVARNASSQLLLVNPTYKARWDLPGGILEHGEDPVSGLKREIQEELQVESRVGELLAVDYGSRDWEGAEVIMMTFTVQLDPAVPELFDFSDGELSEAGYFDLQQALTMVTPRMSDRLRVALELVPPGEHGILVTRPLRTDRTS